ncbi:MAG: hypothetical protein WCV93_01650 [Candidatus Shapirobacteria bacterium]
MRDKKAGVLSVSFGFVGAFVGAGFISGQELVQFFIRFGVGGWWAWLATVVIISLGGGWLLGWIVERKYESFKEMSEDFFGLKWSKVVSAVIGGYLAGGLMIMLSGAGNLVEELLGVEMFWAVLLVAGLMLLVILGGGERMMTVNRLLVPVLIISTLVATVRLCWSRSWGGIGEEIVIKNPSPMLINPLVSFLLYIGYNALGAIVALINIARQTKKGVGVAGGVLGGLIISILGSLLMLALWLTYPIWNQADLPIMWVLRENWRWFYYLFAPSVLVAMFGVATAYALGMSKYLNCQFKLPFRLCCFLLVLVSVPIATLGFSRLLGIIYPFFGMMAVGILVMMITKLLINKNRNYDKPFNSIN